MNVEKIKQNKIVDQVMLKIKELIASGKYKPGDKLPTETELAEMFGIGRSSLREAIKIFNYLGVLKSLPAKGTYVCNRSNISKEALSWAMLLGEDDFNDLIEIRASMEMWSIMKLTKSCGEHPEKNKQTITKLEKCLLKMSAATEKGLFAETNKADLEFHNIIIKSSKNTLFASIYETLKSFMLEEVKKVHKIYHDLNEITQNHEKLLQAIKSGSVSEAVEVTVEHINDTKKIFISESK